MILKRDYLILKNNKTAIYNSCFLFYKKFLKKEGKKYE